MIRRSFHVAANQPGPHPDSLACDRRGDVGHLDWRDGHATLADAGGPGGEVAPRSGIRIRQLPARLGDSDPCRPTKPEMSHPIAQPLYAQSVGYIFEVDVARSLDRIHEREMPIKVS